MTFCPFAVTGQGRFLPVFGNMPVRGKMSIAPKSFLYQRTSRLRNDSLLFLPTFYRRDQFPRTEQYRSCSSQYNQLDIRIHNRICVFQYGQHVLQLRRDNLIWVLQVLFSMHLSLYLQLLFLCLYSNCALYHLGIFLYSFHQQKKYVHQGSRSDRRNS